MSRSQLCKDCYWFMSSINVIMEGEELNSHSSRDGGNSSGSSVAHRNLAVINLKKYLKMLPDSYEFFSKMKPKSIWLKLLQIYDRQKSLYEVTFKVLRQLTFED